MCLEGHNGQPHRALQGGSFLIRASEVRLHLRGISTELRAEDARTPAVATGWVPAPELGCGGIPWLC